ncbi:MAG: hypothetical protein IKD74_02300 [Clostridia bacterium]|nr:hypothetical protein [Clostridia bacterium]
MGLGAMVAKAASKVANKAKEGVKNKLKGKDDDTVKQMIKRVLIMKVGIPVGAFVIVVACVSIIMQQLFKNTNSSIKVSAQKIKQSFEAGELAGDPDQINFAIGLEEMFGSCIGFTSEQIDIIYNNTLADLEGEDATYKETYSSNYGTITPEIKSDIVNKYNEIKDNANKRDKDYDVVNYYNLSREGKFNNMISPYDKQPLYKHILMTEKYNFNNITWKAFFHNSDEVNDVSKDNMTYDTTYQLLYPKANANVKDMINLVSPYLMTCHIPLSFLTSSMYSSSASDQSIGTTWVQQNEAAAQGRNNNIGNFAYEIVKHGYSDITINQYNLESRTTSSYWLDYHRYECSDSFTIVQTVSEDGTDGNGNKKYKRSYSVKPNTYVDGTTQLTVDKGQTNTRWNDAHEEIPANETPVGDPSYATTTQYKLSHAIAFDVKINNSFNYEKYSNEEADKRENPESILSQVESEYTKLENGEEAGESNTAGNHITQDQLNGYNESQLASLFASKGGDTNSTSVGTHEKVYTTENYMYRKGTRHDITRFWTDTVSSNPSQTKTLLSTGEVIAYNKNTKNDPSMDTVSDSDFNADSASKSYYERLQGTEGTAINTIDMLNANPKVFLKYVDNSSKTAKYVGYSRSDYAVDQGMEYLIEYLTEMADNNNGTLPFVYGASFGFDVNALAASGFGNYTSGMDLLRQFINSWEDPGDRMRTESGAVTTNEDEAKNYVVYSDNASNPASGIATVGFGINLKSQFNDVKEAMEAAGLDFPYASYQDIYNKMVAGEVMLMDKNTIDSVQEEIIQRKIDLVKSKTNGIELKQYQLFALVDRAYNGWNNINGKDFATAYNEYWHEDTDDKYEALYEKYKDNQENKDAIVAELDFNNPLYVNFLQYTTGTSAEDTYKGWAKRRKADYILFQGGYFLGGYSLDKMCKFYTSTMSPGNVQLIKADGTIDETACYQLQLWFEQNYFTDKFHLPPNVRNWRKIMTNGGIDAYTNTDNYYHCLAPEFIEKYEGEHERGLRFQCTWWACARGNVFLVDNNLGKLLDHFPDGQNCASHVSNSLHLPLNRNIYDIRPNSVISWYPQHVGYVEAVCGDLYITSECGSGKTWNGVYIRSKSADAGKFAGSVCLEDLVH